MNNTTLLDDLLNENIDIEERVQLNIDNLCQILVDFSVSVDIRIQAINMYYKLYNNEIVEVLKRLISIFNFSRTVLLREYLQHICLFSNIPYEFRLETAKDLCFCEDSDDCFRPLDLLCRELGKYYIPTPKKTEAVYVLMRRQTFKESATLHFFNLIDDINIDSEHRYKIITSLKTNFDQRKQWATKEEKIIIDQELLYYERVSFLHYIQNSQNAPSPRILCGQALLMKYSESVEDVLISIAKDENCNYNVRADATDVVLRYGNDTYKQIAKEIIIELGHNGASSIKNIYDNAQNAHTLEIEQSAVESLEKLSNIPLIKKDNSDDFIDFEYVLNKFNNINNKNINITLNRISLDHALYSKLNCSLRSVFVMIYSYIMKSEHKEVLLERLDEELSESAGICSTGILERLINTLSGFDEELGLHISFEDQILGNLSGRLNAKIRELMDKECLHKTNKHFCSCLQNMCDYSKKYITRIKTIKIFTPCTVCIGCVQADKIKNKQVTMDDLECIHRCNEDENCNEMFIDTILSQMTIPTKYFERRTMFLKFFRTYISDIMEDIREEFKDYVDIQMFDLYFRKATIMYEGEI
jgi:hypothetical protein